MVLMISHWEEDGGGGDDDAVDPDEHDDGES